MSGFDILFLHDKDLDLVFVDIWLLERVHRLQKCIVDDLLRRQGSSSLSGVAAGEDADHHQFDLREPLDRCETVSVISESMDFERVVQTITHEQNDANASQCIDQQSSCLPSFICKDGPLETQDFSTENTAALPYPADVPTMVYTVQVYRYPH